MDTGKQIWLDSRLALIKRHHKPVVLRDEGGWGAPFLITSLKEQTTTFIWLQLSAADAGNPLSQGEKLADAIARALGAPLFRHAVSVDQGLDSLHSHLELLKPLVFALSGAEHDVSLAHEIMKLSGPNCQIILHCYDLPGEFLNDQFVLSSSELKLSFDEAADLAEGQLSRKEIELLLRKSQGAYEHFIKFLAEFRGEASPTIPSPYDLSVYSYASDIEVDTLIYSLVQRERYLEAIDLTIGRQVEGLSSLLTQVHSRLWLVDPAKLQLLLKKVKPPFSQTRQVLFWHLVSDLELGKAAERLADVEGFIERENDAELRSLYARALYRLGSPERALQEAQIATQHVQSPLTLTTYGALLHLSDMEQAKKYLLKAMRLSETHDDIYWTAKASMHMAAVQIGLGYYQAAIDYVEWGLKIYEQEKFALPNLEQGLLNEWAFAKVLIGKAQGMADKLKYSLGSTKPHRPMLSFIIKSTLADISLSEGKIQEAMDSYKALWEDNRRQKSYGYIANCYVRVLLEEKAHKRALEVAEKAVSLTENQPPVFRRRSLLALGMALSSSDPHRALEVLKEAQLAFLNPLHAPRLAQASLYLAKAQLDLDQKEEAKITLAKAGHSLKNLGTSGVYYLAGPIQDFQEVLALVEGYKSPLELKLLTNPVVRLRGEIIELRPRFLDILVALLLNPQNLSSEKLTLYVYGESGNPTTCMADLSKLKHLIPIASKPYRLMIKAWADFLELPRLLNSGQIREAVELYKGPFLPSSNAPIVVSHRDFLEESLRAAVIHSNDKEALFTLADRLGEDLALWEATLAVLSDDDPRRVYVQAKVKQIKQNWKL